jgi:hypothetical protein
MKIFWRAVLVNAVSIGTKGDISESIVHEVETEFFYSFSIIIKVKLPDLLLCHPMTWKMRIICLSERYITFLADKLGLGGVVMSTKHVIPLGIPHDHCNWAFDGDKKRLSS